MQGNTDPSSCRNFLRTPTFAVRLHDHPKLSNAFDLADALQWGMFLAIHISFNFTISNLLYMSF